jgi:succinate dehydrogenase / fumarate reductase cytochrome b subunit
MSPHLQVWRWHATMLGSILHRVSGVGLYVGAIVVTAWLAALALGLDAYGLYLTYAAHPLALIVWIGFTACAFYHLASGLKHLLWDTGSALGLKAAGALTNFSLWFAVIATIAFWAVIFSQGRVRL